jgi:hypothetical protein
MDITPEIRQAVAEDECRRTGHAVDAVLTMASTDPVAVRCSTCGRTWSVGPGPGGYGPEPADPAGDSNADSNAVTG